MQKDGFFNTWIRRIVSFGSARDQAFKKLKTQDFKSLIQEKKDAYLIDVRTPKEFKAGHIKGAKNINIFNPHFKNMISKLKKEKPIFLYCRSGSRSAKAARMLSKMGFEEVYDLKGGFNLWS